MSINERRENLDSYELCDWSLRKTVDEKPLSKGEAALTYSSFIDQDNFWEAMELARDRYWGWYSQEEYVALLDGRSLICPEIDKVSTKRAERLAQEYQNIYNALSIEVEQMINTRMGLNRN